MALTKFGRLVACFRLSDLDVGEWHGKKTGIVVGRSKSPPLCYPLFTPLATIPDDRKQTMKRALDARLPRVPGESPNHHELERTK
ncbi:hypothetical protein [Burkholderia ambifaria]|uniref:hypothetical protein n=1 Tax=Burkholderia ambifaria TaxID=152480 RepID=UPI001589E75E|nr:hypothetical protein [Burkholderia ambifaria]MBR8334590.1 hypothetical protein [Burkholderia ambifaria]